MSQVSEAQVEELSVQLQQQGNKQTGTLITDLQGNVLASSGDLKESADRVARTLLTLLQDANGVFVHSQQPGESKEELARIVVSFKTYQYALTLTNDLIVCVKSNLD